MEGATGKHVKHIPPSLWEKRFNIASTRRTKIGKISWNNDDYHWKSFSREDEYSGILLLDHIIKKNGGLMGVPPLTPALRTHFQQVLDRDIALFKKEMFDLGLEIRLKVPLPPCEIPRRAVEDVESYRWTVEMDQVASDAVTSTHPLFTVIRSLIGRTGFGVQVRIDKLNRTSVTLYFAQKEPVRNSHGYLRVVGDLIDTWVNK
ncbi:MAG TPA: hypothetical protein VLA04_05550 [Verrucomicrobiae bacterium]|nr:hypothetical protein [Verrucomicrobiae bacterium]